MLVDATLQALNTQLELFERAAHWRATPRERIVALTEAEEVFFQMHRYHYRALQVVRVAAQLTATPERRDHVARCESRLIGLLTDVIHDAVQCGDLPLGGRLREGELPFVLWSLAFGTRALMNTLVATRQLGIADGFSAARTATDLLLDGINLRPLSTEVSYDVIRERIRTELFAREWGRVQAA